tara:strand:- start:2052 stop:2255 length:204 start_codon:yes stop_codon:yes gene_type:complete
MKDTIKEEDLLIDVTKTELEKRLVKTETDNSLLREELSVVKTQMRKIQELVKDIHEKKVVSQHIHVV